MPRRAARRVFRSRSIREEAALRSRRSSEEKNGRLDSPAQAHSKERHASSRLAALESHSTLKGMCAFGPAGGVQYGRGVNS